MRKDYEKIKRETNFSLIENSREEVIGSLLKCGMLKIILNPKVLAQKRKDPDTHEAFQVDFFISRKDQNLRIACYQYYAATFDYTEKLRNVLIGLRKRLV